MITDPWLFALAGFALLFITSGLVSYINTKPKFNVASLGTEDTQVFSHSTLLSSELEQWLNEHYRDLQGLLRVWQRRAWYFGWLHNFVVFWTGLISLALPFVIPFIGESAPARLFIEVTSATSAIIYGLHSRFRVQVLYESYRQHESAVYDVVRHMKEAPEEFGVTDEERRRTYFVSHSADP